MIIGKSISRLAFKEDKRQKKARIIILCPGEVTDHLSWMTPSQLWLQYIIDGVSLKRLPRNIKKHRGESLPRCDSDVSFRFFSIPWGFCTCQMTVTRTIVLFRKPSSQKYRKDVEGISWYTPSRRALKIFQLEAHSDNGTHLLKTDLVLRLLLDGLHCSFLMIESMEHCQRVAKYICYNL